MEEEKLHKVGIGMNLTEALRLMKEKGYKTYWKKRRDAQIICST